MIMTRIISSSHTLSIPSIFWLRILVIFDIRPQSTLAYRMEMAQFIHAAASYHVHRWGRWKVYLFSVIHFVQVVRSTPGRFYHPPWRFAAKGILRNNVGSTKLEVPGKLALRFVIREIHTILLTKKILNVWRVKYIASENNWHHSWTECKPRINVSETTGHSPLLEWLTYI